MESAEDHAKKRKKHVLTAVVMGYSEPDTILRLLKAIYQIPNEEIEKYFKELESDGLITRYQGKLHLTDKGLEAIRKIGIDEELVKELLEKVEVAIKPFLTTPRKFGLSKLEVTPIDVKSLSNVSKLIEVRPLLILAEKFKLTHLYTYELVRDEVTKWILEMPAFKLISFTRPRIKLFRLHDLKEIESSLITLVKLLVIRSKPLKLIAIEESTAMQQPTKPAVPPSPSAERSVPPVVVEEDVSVGEEEISSIVEGFFELEEPDDVLGVAGVVYDRPVIIVAIKHGGYEYIDVLRYVLRVLYRIAVSGLPQGEYFTPNPSLITEPLRFNLEIERAYSESTRQGVIKVLDFTGVKSGEFVNLALLRNRLREHLVEALSFTIIYVDESVSDRIIKFLNSYRGEFGAEVIVVRPRILPPEQLEKLAALAWGYVSVSEGRRIDYERPLELHSPNSMFTLFAERFNRDLRRIYSYAMKKGIVEVVKPSKHDTIRESSEHYFLKVFAAHYFVEKERVDIRDIAVEEPICGHVVPDVHIRSRNIAIEIETLYGEGPAWPNKLRETIEKYKGCGEVSEVWLVIPPLQASIYSKYLVSMLKRLRESRVIQAGIRLLTVDLEDEKFVSIAKIGKQVKDYLKPRQTPHESFK